MPIDVQSLSLSFSLSPSVLTLSRHDNLDERTHFLPDICYFVTTNCPTRDSTRKGKGKRGRGCSRIKWKLVSQHLSSYCHYYYYYYYIKIAQHRYFTHVDQAHRNRFAVSIFSISFEVLYRHQCLHEEVDLAV